MDQFIKSFVSDDDNWLDFSFEGKILKRFGYYKFKEKQRVA